MSLARRRPMTDMTHTDNRPTHTVNRLTHVANRLTRAAIAMIAVTVAFATLPGCGGGQNGGRADSAAVAPVAVTDSMAAVLLTPYADTVYASAAAVKATVTVYDKNTPGTVSSLADMYADAPGIMTFRGGPWRRAVYNGHVDQKPTTIDVIWEFTTDEDFTPTKYGRWGGGTGWTGQPLYVEWPDSCIKAQRQGGGMTKDFGPREVIVGSLACKLYFINFDTGLASRTPIATGGNPIKGTPSLDPTLNGNLYVGQGVPAHRPFGAFTVDLRKHAITQFKAEDPKALRHWDAYDSSPLRLGQFLFRPGENGIIYKYVVGADSLTLHSTLRYSVRGASPGIEASMAACRNYGYTADNHGNVLCFNLNTLTPVWHYDIGDDVDATPVLALEPDSTGRQHPYLYVCCEVDRQKDDGEARMAKLDAENGRVVWLNTEPAVRYEDESEGKHFDGGYYGTPLVGTGDCEDLVFAHCVLNDDPRERNGVLRALDRRTGAEVYRTALRAYAWSSPVALTDSQGHMYIFTADCWGFCYVLNGRDGKVLVKRHVGHNFESSPIVVGNNVVVGTRGKSIYRLAVR